MFYGTKSGEFGEIDLQRDQPVPLWTVDSNSRAPVTHIHADQLTNNDGSSEVVIAREDGSVEVYSFDGTNAKPQLRYNLNMGESITGLGIGNVSREDYKEVVLSSFSGKVASLIDTSSNEIDPFE